MTRDQQALPLLPMPTQPRELVENFRRLSQHVNLRSNPVGGQDSISSTAGGQQLSVTASASISANPINDARVLHRLGRVPTTIVWFKPLDDPADRLYGIPEGGASGVGANETAWDSKAVWLRSNRAGARFVFVIT